MFDAILVLGCPTNADGTLSNIQKDRIQHAIDLYVSHYAQIIIISGGSVHNEYSEADVMATYVKQQVPNANILLETKARNTYQNIAYTHAICEKHLIQSLLVVTSPSHKRRSCFFIKKFFQNFEISSIDKKDPYHFYLYEYMRLWNTLYYEIKLKNK